MTLERIAYIMAFKDIGLVKLASKAPRGCEIDKHRAALL
jgi:hypothetical protein